MYKTAVISKGKKYRYLLTRVWNMQLPLALWVMLNPSKADAELDDNTIRRCMGFSRAWGYGGIAVVNLYAWRSTDPMEMWKASSFGQDIIGKKNDRFLQQMASQAELIIVAWGSHGPAPRASQVYKLLRDHHDKPLMCLGTTVTGQPLHPLRLAKATKLREWKPVA